MYRKLAQVLLLLVSRQTLWRLGRFLYMKARSDVPNNMQTNGERTLQLHFLDAFADNAEKITVFDVGANVGDWTSCLLERAIALQMDEMDGHLEIHLFEPVPAAFQQLAIRMQRYGDRFDLQLQSMAASDSHGPAAMFIFGDAAEMTNSLHQAATDKVGPSIQVEKITLDEYCGKNGIDSIHFLKCDTEGHDMQVMAGGKRMFQSGKIKVCQFEYNHRWIFSRHYLKDVFDHFSELPYNIGKITPDGIELYGAWHPELERFFEGNYVLIHDSALEWLPVKTGQFDSRNTYGTGTPNAFPST
jgi:FkbM family methyltransferase